MKKIKAKIIKGFCYLYHCPNCTRLFKIAFKKMIPIKCICGEMLEIEYPKLEEI